jgi:hypothetical protein
MRLVHNSYSRSFSGRVSETKLENIGEVKALASQASKLRKKLKAQGIKAKKGFEVSLLTVCPISILYTSSSIPSRP